MVAKSESPVENGGKSPVENGGKHPMLYRLSTKMMQDFAGNFLAWFPPRGGALVSPL